MGLLGVVIERVAYRRLRNAPRLAPLITAIGVSFILQDILVLDLQGADPAAFPRTSYPRQLQSWDPASMATCHLIVRRASR